MIFSIYEIAMYEIVKMIHSYCPSYHFVPEKDTDYEQYSEKCKKLVTDIIKFTDELKLNFPAIDANTYCMIMCGMLMQTFVSDLDFDIKNIDSLKISFADNAMKNYLKHIYYAIESIRWLYSFNEKRDIFEWPQEFSFDYSGLRDNYEEFENEVLAAIDECPHYSYAYCLFILPYMNSLQGVSFDFEKANIKEREAFVKSHKYMGDELFRFVLFGKNIYSRLTYAKNIEGKEVFFTRKIAEYATKMGYKIENIKDAEIDRGYFIIDNEKYPAGIPFFRQFYTEEFTDLLKETFDYIPQECDGVYLRQEGSNILTDQGDFRIEFRQYAIYSGMCHFMPFFDSMSRSEGVEELIRTESLNHTISSLLDVSAEEMERLEKANIELERMNDSLKRHIQLNQELVRSLSHSSANYLNSGRLAQTGAELHQASDSNPSLEKLHLDGLSLMLQSEQELYLSRQLNSLVWRCSADMTSLTQQIQSGLSKENGLNVIAPFEFALKTVLSRILFREDDKRSEFIKCKFKKSDEEWTQTESSFMLDVLANDRLIDGDVISWSADNRLIRIDFIVSELWKDLKIIKNKAFYDLIAEIVTEQLLNALSHGNCNESITVTFGQAEERGGRPRWAYIECVNAVGNPYLGGRGVGISTLNETLLMLNGNKKGLETNKDDIFFESKAWLLTGLLRAL